MLSQATYIWIDGAEPYSKLRSKTRIIEIQKDPVHLDDFPDWSFVAPPPTKQQATTLILFYTLSILFQTLY